MKGEERHKWKSTPPGMSQRRERIWFYLLLVMALLNCLRFFREYQIELAQLYQRQELVWISSRLIRMEDFYVLVQGKYILFGLPMLWCVSSVIFRYLYYYEGSKSIYLMRRLPDRWELHRSCLVRPLLRMALCLGVMATVLMISYGYYMRHTPARWLRPDQWQKLWRAIL